MLSVAVIFAAFIGDAAFSVVVSVTVVCVVVAVVVTVVVAAVVEGAAVVVCVPVLSEQPAKTSISPESRRAVILFFITSPPSRISI
jgi:hypothetical protein